MRLRTLIVFYAALLVATPAFCEANQSIQAGFEYDSNVYKAFGDSRGDMLARLFFKSQGRYAISPANNLAWNFQLGGKKYFNETAKDVLIQYIELPYTLRFSESFAISIIPEFKFQDENNAIEPLPANLPTDVNEDFYSPSGRFILDFRLPGRFAAQPFGQYAFFRFTGLNAFSYHLERGGMTIRRSFPHSIQTGATYSYMRQQFFGGPREDTGHEVSVFGNYLDIPYFSIRYTFQSAGSSDPRYSDDNHRITLLLSFPFGRRESADLTQASDPDEVDALFALHFMGTLQFRRFPSVYDQTAEGRRFLLTGAEDENFNSILVKFSVHPTRSLAIETKFTRYSNDFSNQQDSFDRALVYGGLRLAF